MNNCICTFERIILIKRIPYAVYWIAIGILGFLLGEALVRIFGEDYSLVGRIIASIAFSFIPILNIWLCHKFSKIMTAYSKEVWDDRETVNNWLREQQRYIFTLQSSQAKLVTGTIILVGLLTVFFLGVPFNSRLFSAIAVTAFTLLLWFSGQTLYISIALLQTLRDIVNKPTNIPFFLVRHPNISKLQNYYLTAALSVAVLYFLLIVAIWQGPYGFHSVMLIWLTFLAFYPLTMFLWSYSQIHFLLSNTKQSQIQVVNKKVQVAFSQLTHRLRIEDIDRLEKLMNIQNEIQTLREWPFTLSGAVTFLITLLTAITQLVLVMREISSP